MRVGASQTLFPVPGLKTKEGAGRVEVEEFDRKNGRPLERKIGIIGKEDLNGQLYNAGSY